MKTIWSSKIENSLKIRTFNTTIEPILLYAIANAGQSTPQCVIKYIVVIPGYLE